MTITSAMMVCTRKAFCFRVWNTASPLVISLRGGPARRPGDAEMPDQSITIGQRTPPFSQSAFTLRSSL
jgi:hypothetical protein